MNFIESVISAAEASTGFTRAFMLKVFFSLIVIAFYLLARRFIASILRRKINDAVREYIAGKTSMYLLGFISAVALFRIWLGGIQGLVAYVGIVSAGMAIALQDPITNLAGWIFITIRKPFDLGDRIQIGEHKGDVIDVRLFQFSLMEVGNWVEAEQITGRVIHVPNAWVFRQTICNYTQGFNLIWDEIPVTVTFESDWRKAKGLLEEIAGRNTFIKSEDAAKTMRLAADRYMINVGQLTPMIWTSVADNGVTLTIRYLCEPHHRRTANSAVWEEILTAFAAANDIDLAYPTTRFYHNAHEGKEGARAKLPGAA